MLIYDGDSDIQKEKEEPPPYLPPSLSVPLPPTNTRDSDGDAAENEGEKHREGVLVAAEENVVQEAKTKVGRLLHRATAQLARWGLEVNGIIPTSEEDRTDRRLYQFFFVWFSANANILTLSAGTVGPAYYDLGIRDSLYVILVVDIIACAFPAFFATFGPKLGTRAMVQSRFAWGYYGAIIPSILNVLSMQGYLVINTIIGGQVLAKTSDHVSATVGIVIIAFISLLITFCGCRMLHWYQTLIWIPNIVAFIVMLAVGGKQVMSASVLSPTPAPPAMLVSFGSSLAATVLSWSTITPDYGVYHDKDASAWRVFFYAYLGFFLSSLPVHMLGAAFGATALSVPSWEAGLGNGNDVGGLVAAILAPTKGFGKFLLVLLSLTAPSACAPTMYTVCTSFMTIHRNFAHMPRFLIAVVSTIILIPLAIIGAAKFYSTFVDILALIGYWLAPYCAIALTEHFIFRRGSYAPTAYPVRAAWDRPRHGGLPSGAAAACALAASAALIVPCIEQAWFTGPIAARGTGDLGVLVGFVVAVPVYAGARGAEVWYVARSRKGRRGRSGRGGGEREDGSEMDAMSERGRGRGGEMGALVSYSSRWR
ncbi:permease for cytosine/purines, uracil, thiamine, allantoin-domain-containing protein [Trametes polyzona]|nr:permease for cytosine/purines, uracil, thiamine, allantoin-domain-containing protein [Trametes polyzona]